MMGATHGLAGVLAGAGLAAAAHAAAAERQDALGARPEQVAFAGAVGIGLVGRHAFG